VNSAGNVSDAAFGLTIGIAEPIKDDDVEDEEDELVDVGKEGASTVEGDGNVKAADDEDVDDAEAVFRSLPSMSRNNDSYLLSVTSVNTRDC
jgi:hypothetical protein